MNTRIAQILDYMPDKLKQVISKTIELTSDSIEEIRIRINKPLIIGTMNGNFAILPDGSLSPALGGAYIVTESDVRMIFQAICESSVYAYMEDIKQGFITVRGGHRIGFVGKAVTCGGKVMNFRDISSLNIRIAREVIGASSEFIDKIIIKETVVNTLVVSPPNGGKTTALRDIARQISNKGIKVAIADDRGEIAAMFKGIPQNDVGIQTDIIENAPKFEAVIMMLRSMSPQVIVSDEIATNKDVIAIQQCFGTGIAVIGSTHGSSAEEVINRPMLAPLFENGGFGQIIVLSKDEADMRRKFIGEVVEVKQ